MREFMKVFDINVTVLKSIHAKSSWNVNQSRTTLLLRFFALRYSFSLNLQLTPRTHILSLRVLGIDPLS